MRRSSFFGCVLKIYNRVEGFDRNGQMLLNVRYPIAWSFMSIMAKAVFQNFQPFSCNELLKVTILVKRNFSATISHELLHKLISNFLSTDISVSSVCHRIFIGRIESPEYYELLDL